MSQAENGFELHPQLAKDCFVVGDLALDRVLLMNDANYPWLVLVPRRAGLRELYELDAADLAMFWHRSPPREIRGVFVWAQRSAQAFANPMSASSSRNSASADAAASTV